MPLMRCTNYKRCSNVKCRHITSHFKDNGCSDKEENAHCKTASGRKGCHNWCKELEDPLDVVMSEIISK